MNLLKHRAEDIKTQFLYWKTREPQREENICSVGTSHISHPGLGTLPLGASLWTPTKECGWLGAHLSQPLLNTVPAFKYIFDRTQSITQRDKKYTVQQSAQTHTVFIMNKNTQINRKKVSSPKWLLSQGPMVTVSSRNLILYFIYCTIIHQSLQEIGSRTSTGSTVFAKNLSYTLIHL